MGTKKSYDELERENAGLLARIAKLEEQLLTDSATGIPNQRACREWLGRRIGKAPYKRRAGITAITVVFIDLNGLGAMNTKLGHMATNKVIADYARFLKDMAREDDLVGRMHDQGDEFLFFLPRTDEEGVEPAIRRIDARVRSHVFRVVPDNGTTEVEVRITAKYGAVTWYDTTSATADDLLRAASVCQQKAKAQRGPNPDALSIVVERYVPQAN